jgi:Fe2+ transport system protein B
VIQFVHFLLCFLCTQSKGEAPKVTHNAPEFWPAKFQSNSATSSNANANINTVTNANTTTAYQQQQQQQAALSHHQAAQQQAAHYSAMYHEAAAYAYENQLYQQQQQLEQQQQQQQAQQAEGRSKDDKRELMRVLCLVGVFVFVFVSTIGLRSRRREEWGNESQDQSTLGFTQTNIIYCVCQTNIQHNKQARASHAHLQHTDEITVVAVVGQWLGTHRSSSR